MNIPLLQLNLAKTFLLATRVLFIINCLILNIRAHEEKFKLIYISEKLISYFNYITNCRPLPLPHPPKKTTKSDLPKNQNMANDPYVM